MSTLKVNTLENLAGTSSIGVEQMSKTSFKNLLINGNFDVWQRGTTFAYVSGVTYTTDRWFTWQSGTDLTLTRVVGENSKYAINIDGLIGNTICEFGQRIESLDAYYLAGKNVTFSGKVYSSKVQDVDIYFRYPSVVDNFTLFTTFNTQTISLAIGWNDIEETYLMPSGVQNGLSVMFHFDSGLTSGNVKFETMQVEEGSVATEFEQKPIGTELVLCQRYYQQIDFAASVVIDGYYSAGSYMPWAQVRPVKMRANPTTTLTSGSALNLSEAPSVNAQDDADMVGLIARVSAAGRAYYQLTKYTADAEL